MRVPLVRETPPRHTAGYEGCVGPSRPPFRYLTRRHSTPYVPTIFPTAGLFCLSTSGYSRNPFGARCVASPTR